MLCFNLSSTFYILIVSGDLDMLVEVLDVLEVEGLSTLRVISCLE